MTDQMTPVARIGTCDGRMLEIAIGPHHIRVGDERAPHTGWILNNEQAVELAQALLAAAYR